MATLTPLKTKITAIKDTIDGIKQFVYDDLSKINADSQATYPLLLLKPPTGEYEDRTMTYKLMDVDMFVFVPELNTDVDNWTVKGDVCEDLLVKVLRELFVSGAEFILVGKVKMTPGHVQHNAKLVGARAQFKLRVFNPCS